MGLLGIDDPIDPPYNEKAKKKAFDVVYESNSSNVSILA
jgi:hypothetical protein